MYVLFILVTFKRPDDSKPFWLKIVVNPSSFALSTVMSV